MSRGEETTGGAAPGSGGWGKRLLFLLPVIVFVVLVGYFIWGLQPGRDPRSVPSGLVDKPIPAFDLAPVSGLDVPGVSKAAIAQTDGPVILNVFASWCGPCRIEHPIWMRLAERREVPIYGINYKDRPQDARGWLARHGNPYARVGALPDSKASVGIDLGIYGVPETYLIGPDGIIRFKHDGPVTGKILRKEILPRLDKWAAQG